MKTILLLFCVALLAGAGEPVKAPIDLRNALFYTSSSGDRDYYPAKDTITAVSGTVLTTAMIEDTDANINIINMDHIGVKLKFIPVKDPSVIQIESPIEPIVVKRGDKWVIIIAKPLT